MRKNEFETFQDLQKCINHFYLQLIQNGPDLPKKEIVYMDFLKKVTSESAEIFLRQQKNQFETFKSVSEEKQKYLNNEIKQLKTKLNLEVEEKEEKITSLSTEKR